MNMTPDAGKEAAEQQPAASSSPYEDYDFMPLEKLRSLASERGVVIPPDVEKAHLITGLRAYRSGTELTTRQKRG